VHEAGHFLAAKAFGIKVEKFGFGLPVGPTLFKTQWGETEILVHACLLGGYVAFPDSDEKCDLPEDSQDRFLNRPVHQRLVVVSAGVIANVICAFVLVLFTAIMWGHMPSGKYDIFVGNIVAPKAESVWKSGMKAGDRIMSINGSKVDTTFALLDYIRLSKANDGKIDVAAENSTYNELKELNPVLDKNDPVPSGVAVVLPPAQSEKPLKINDKVLKGLEKYKTNQLTLTPAQVELRGTLKGKKVYVSDGKFSLTDISYALTDGVRPVYIQVKRENNIINLKPIYPNSKGLIGIRLSAKEILIPTKSFKSILKASNKYLYDNTYMMIYGLYQICTGKIPLQDLHGIVAITKVGGDIIQNSGIFYGLLLTALISMDLAIVNFLPIPALDGGHVFFLIIEKLRGKPISEKVLEKISNAGFTFLILLMFLVIFNDIFGLITKKY
jgi:regulator of sigma E protease